MNRSHLGDWLRVLAAEPANDTMDPWPNIRRRAQRAQRSRTARLLKVPLRAWATGAAAVLVIGFGLGVAVLFNQVQTASAAETLYQLQEEAYTTSPAAGPCAPPDVKLPSAAGGNVAFGGGDAPGVVTVSSQDVTQLSDKLAQALGVSSDRLRQAMRQTLSADVPSGPPPDPIAGIARELGVSTEQVCAAFSNPHEVGAKFSAPSPNGKHVTAGGGPGLSVVLNIGGTEINLETTTADQLSEPAHKLGVSPERLLAAIKASIPAPPPLPPNKPNPDDLINRLAKNLEMSPDKVRAAITQVEGPNRFFFAVPLPDLGR